MNFVLLWSLVLCSEVPEETGSNSFLKDQPSAVRTSCWAVRRSVIFILQGSAGSKAPEASNGQRQTRIIQTCSQSKTDSLGNFKNSTCSSLWPLTPGSLQPDVTTGRLHAFKGLTSSVTWQQQKKNANTNMNLFTDAFTVLSDKRPFTLVPYKSSLFCTNHYTKYFSYHKWQREKKGHLKIHVNTHTHSHTQREKLWTGERSGSDCG